jgi:4-diphosphocytidyl-2-C-methyl-D-erythritol kinase
MYVHRRRTRIEIWTPAKLNLFLEVLGRRTDGYHEIETLMVPISLFDTLRCSWRGDGRIEFSARWLGPDVAQRDATDRRLDRLPAPHENLVYRALELLRARAGVEAGVEARLYKRIPAAAGLGGGSSDAAAALLAANWLWGLNWSRDQLAELAAELGSDIPFFLYDSPAYCRGRGERVTPMDLGERPHFVILRPPQGLSTAAVYAQTQTAALPRRIVDDGRGRRGRGRAQWASHLFNRLQAGAEQLAPWLRDVQQQFNRLDLLGHQLSGSGSAYFGVCRDARQAGRAAAILRSRCAGQVFCAGSVIGRRCRVLPASPN